ncbi:hypothetical protein JK635_08020 [Neobacillus sp. YIM B02564]|uniref:DUF6788 domain-containing protein n=1 Tax=Neobacillus paridis TaxID=2803862 RepID=A0ABS1TLL6_9BACI|nr:DUF6788 family protein [Neobacillus paridis]MBL4952157.1 hypothetical protein [Neobacillus paridis]
MVIKEISKELIHQIEHLSKKYESLESLKQTILSDLPTLRDKVKERMEGTIVMKKICCHKKNCSTCGGTRNEHGPYPHLQWRDEKTGKIKTRYISRKNLPYFEEQLELSKKVFKRERVLVKINERQQKIFLTLDTCLFRMKGKEVNRDV